MTYCFDGVVCNIANCDYISLLSHSVHSIQRLCFHHRIPVWLNKVDIVGGCEIDARQLEREVSME
jgi:hypothetical protein